MKNKMTARFMITMVVGLIAALQSPLAGASQSSSGPYFSSNNTYRNSRDTLGLDTTTATSTANVSGNLSATASGSGKAPAGAVLGPYQLAPGVNAFVGPVWVGASYSDATPDITQRFTVTGPGTFTITVTFSDVTATSSSTAPGIDPYLGAFCLDCSTGSRAEAGTLADVDVGFFVCSPFYRGCPSYEYGQSVRTITSAYGVGSQSVGGASYTVSVTLPVTFNGTGTLAVRAAIQAKVGISGSGSGSSSISAWVSNIEVTP